MTRLADPRLLDCRRIFLRDYAVQLSIGVHEFEKRGPQRVLINVDLYVPLAQSTPRRDAIDEVLDYDFIVLGMAVALLVVDGIEHGFGPWEKTILAAGWLAPIYARTVAGLLAFPIGLLSLIAVFVLILARVRASGARPCASSTDLSFAAAPQGATLA